MDSYSIIRDSVDTEENFIVTYELEGRKTLYDAAWELAVGQSVGNPHVRNRWETDDLFDKYSCKIIGNADELRKVQRGLVKIAFPIINTNWKEDGITQLMVQVMGGQLDIDDITYCKLIDLSLPKSVTDNFLGPKFGMKKVREYVGVHDKPLLGGIVKPKTGLSVQCLLDIVKEMVDGGVNFIKEDEILSNPSFCTIEERVPPVMEYIKNCGRNVVYCVCINADYPYVLDRVKKVYELGGNGVHINFWNGLGVYKSVRELDLPIFVHFQKSGDKILTDESHRFHIDFKVIVQLAGLMGVDFMHVGMWGGYSQTSEDEMKRILDVAKEYDIVPALSCGMNPVIVTKVTEKFGNDYMANTGGAIHGHPGGTISGAKAMRDSIDGNFESKEYKLAFDKWGPKQ